MAAAETLDISDLVFVNWEKTDYDLASISEDNSSVNSEISSCNIPDLSNEMVDSSFIEIKQSSDTTKSMSCSQDEPIKHDLSILLNCFDDVKNLKEDYSSDFPHLFLEIKAPSPSIIFLFYLTACIGLLSFFFYKDTFSLTPMITDSMFYQSSSMHHFQNNVFDLKAKESPEMVQISSKISKIAKTAINTKNTKNANREIKSKEKTLMSVNSKTSLLYRLQRFLKKIFIKTQSYLKRRIYVLRKKSRLFFSNILAKN